MAHHRSGVSPRELGIEVLSEEEFLRLMGKE